MGATRYQKKSKKREKKKRGELIARRRGLERREYGMF
jgi:hypothetical protein